jgi:hypothetical protein
MLFSDELLATKEAHEKAFNVRKLQEAMRKSRLEELGFVVQPLTSVDKKDGGGDET